jgi:putative ABC transport system permease protein
VGFFILGEAMLTGLLGGLLGLVIAYPMITFGLGPKIEANMGTIFPSFTVDPFVVVTSLALALMLGAIAAAIPAIRASRLRIVDALRRVA